MELCVSRFLCTVDQMKTSGCANLQNVAISNSKKFSAACRSHLTFIHFVLLSFLPLLCVWISMVPTDFLRCYVPAFCIMIYDQIVRKILICTHENCRFLLVPFENSKIKRRNFSVQATGEQSQKFSAWLSFWRGDTGFSTSKVQIIVVFLHRHWPPRIYLCEYSYSVASLGHCAWVRISSNVKFFQQIHIFMNLQQPQTYKL